ncbi:DUF952 domain-containing protein [Umezawaea endophytica]|uniref:DUF952 domain-containing protein n=1 Tax=Umezawaea endophytica TaxID=1654476 RepID=A0A9X2VU43_9PSEU|nr:DUF952 domain-containing protein [Umezawaea endophytica]MCS7482154.1 DUF952 domain-containing protein [Umezawaea endophytica]
MILHITSVAEWATSRERGEVRPDSLATVGFVHCSDPGSVHLPANLLFAGRTDLLLLVVDPAGLPVKWEPGEPEHSTGIWFPHVHGPIPVDSVVRVLDFAPGPDGEFVPPTSI